MKNVIRILIIVFLLGSIVIIFLVYNVNPAPQDVLEEQIFTEEVENIDINTENSRIVFLSSTDDTTRIVLTGNSDDYKLAADLSGNRLEVEVENQSPFSLFSFNRSSTLQVFVPASGLVSLSVDSDNGAIQAEEIIATDVTLEVNNGRIELEAIKSDKIDVEAVNGRVELARLEADINVRSSNGRIMLTEVSGDLQARANNGSINLTVDTLDFPIDLETNNGRIEIRTQTEPTNSLIRARVDNGSIDIYGRDTRELNFGKGEIQIEIKSNNGSISVE